MRIRFLLFILVIFLLATSCDRLLMQEKRQEIDKINLKGLLDTLHYEVSSANPLLIKQAWLNNQFDSSSTRLDSLQWVKEFESFSDVKIRPGRLFSDYHEKVIPTDSTKLFEYTSVNPEKEPLDSLFVLTDNDENIIRIEGYKNDKNFFNSSQEYVDIQFFKNENNRRLPHKYEISGWQKVKTKDTISYKIKASLKY